jgi:hypothetical protein
VCFKASYLYILTSIIFLVIAHNGTASEKEISKNNQKDIDEIYKKGIMAFYRGNHESAASHLVETAQLDWRCLAVYRDPRWQKNPPTGSCVNQSGLKKPLTEEDPAPEALFRLGMIQKKITTKEVEAGRKKNYRYYLDRVIYEYPGNEFTDNASLAVMEDFFCEDDAGYPDCVKMEIKLYEEWLTKFPRSDVKDEVYKKAAESYLELAGKYEEKEAWNSPAKAELCRGRAIQYAAQINIENKTGSLSEWSKEFVKNIIGSEKPYTIVPGISVSGAKEKN